MPENVLDQRRPSMNATRVKITFSFAPLNAVLDSEGLPSRWKWTRIGFTRSGTGLSKVTILTFTNWKARARAGDRCAPAQEKSFAQRSTQVLRVA
jgi:hypothetical protein